MVGKYEKGLVRAIVALPLLTSCFLCFPLQFLMFMLIVCVCVFRPMMVQVEVVECYVDHGIQEFGKMLGRAWTSFMMISRAFQNAPAFFHSNLQTR